MSQKYLDLEEIPDIGALRLSKLDMLEKNKSRTVTEKFIALDKIWQNCQNTHTWLFVSPSFVIANLKITHLIKKRNLYTEFFDAWCGRILFKILSLPS